MHLIDRLEKRARELDCSVREDIAMALVQRRQVADDRELLLEAATRLRACETLLEKVASWSTMINTLAEANKRLGEILK